MFGYFMLNEDITLQKIISTLLVLSGLALVLQPWNDSMDRDISNELDISLFTNSTESPLYYVSNVSVNLLTRTLSTPHSKEAHNVSVIFGYILALCSGIGNASNTAVLKKFSAHLPTDVLTFYICLGGCLLSTLFMLILEEPKWPNNPIDTVWLLVHSTSIGASLLLGNWSKLLMPQILYYITTTNFIIFSLIGQYTLLREINPGFGNLEELIGAVLVILGIALPVVPLIISQNCCENDTVDHSEAHKV